MDAVWGCFRLCCGGLCGGSRVRDPDFDAEHEVLLERGANLAELPREQFTESPAGEERNYALCAILGFELHAGFVIMNFLHDAS